jgi:hypothetical protein
MKPLASTIALLALTSTAGAVEAPCRAVSPAYTVALVELYTSQGCSSCPPADQWLSRFGADQASTHAIPLALHVGYWDYIGWEDPFARKEFNQRQDWLVSRTGSSRAYTPEIFIGAKEVADWSRSERTGAAVGAVNARPARANIELEAHWLPDAGGGGRAAQRLAVQARWQADPPVHGAQLLLAVKRSGYLTDVQAGENRGSRLRNDHVVRAWAGPFASAKQPLATELAVPREAGEAALVAIAQDPASGEVLQALQLELAACQPANDPGTPAGDRKPPR